MNFESQPRLLGKSARKSKLHAGFRSYCSSSRVKVPGLQFFRGGASQPFGERLGLAIRLGHQNWPERPIYGQIVIVPPDCRPSLRIVQSCALVLDFDMVREGAKASSKTRRCPDLLLIFGRYSCPEPFSESG